MLAAFGIDQSVQIPLEIVVKDPGFKPTKQQISTLIRNGHYEVLRFLKKPSRYQIVNAVDLDGRFAKYFSFHHEMVYLVRAKPIIIKYIDENHPSYEQLCIEAVRSDGLVLQYINKQHNDVCLIAVLNDGRALKFCKIQNLDIQVSAVLQNIYAIDYIESKSEEFYFKILSKYPEYWTKITDTPHNRTRAIGENPSCIVMMSNLSDDFIKKCVQIDSRILRFVEQKPELVEFAINICAGNISYIDNQTTELQIMAIQKDPGSIRHIRRPSLDAMRLCISLKPKLITSIEQTDELCKIAINANPKLFEHILKPSDSLVQIAIELDGMNLAHVDDQSPELCAIAIKQNPNAFQYVLDQTPALARLAISLDPANVHYLMPSIVDDIVYENKWLHS